ncbi:hypothetical protein ACFLZX_06545 [Nanoarchaeota archaeon]
MIETNYFLALLVSYLGLVVGIILAVVSPEERAPLRKYFKMFRLLILWTIFLASFLFSFNNFYFIIVLAIFAIYLFVGKFVDKVTFSILGILFYISSYDINSMAVMSSLIFVYGVIVGSYHSARNRGLRNLKILGLNIGYVLIGAILPFIFLYL